MSDRNETTITGKKEVNEMCVLLLTYFVDPALSDLPKDSWLPKCWNGNWMDDFTNIPTTDATLL